MTRQELASPIDIYARVSRKGDRDQSSTTAQVASCRMVLAEQDLQPGEALIDDGRSAWNPRVHREGWDKLMARLESGASGGCIVYDMSRFTRRPIEGERLIAAAERGLIVLDSESTYDLTAANGKKQFRDMLSAAAYYSDDLSRKVRRGKMAKAKLGTEAGYAGHVDRGGKHRAFGFEDDNITPRESEAAVLRDLAARFLAGVSQDRLIAELNERGILTSYGGAWTRAGLRQVLTRERNAGHVVHNGVIVAELPGEPIIRQKTHDRILARYAANRVGRPNSPKYLCSGFAVCGLCGTRLVGRPRNNVRPYADGGVNRQYFCSKSHGGCGRIAADQRALDEAATALAIAVLSDPRHAAQIEAAAAASAEEAATLDALIAADEKLAEEIGGRLGRREITLARHDAVIGPLDARLARLRAQREKLGSSPPVPAKGSRKQWEARWEAAEPAERRDLLGMALRGRVLSIGPADPSRRTDVSSRISLAAPRR